MCNEIGTVYNGTMHTGTMQDDALESTLGM